MGANNAGRRNGNAWDFGINGHNYKNVSTSHSRVENHENSGKGTSNVSGPPIHGDGTVVQASGNRRVIGKSGEKSAEKVMQINKGGRTTSKKAEGSRFAILVENGDDDPMAV